MRSELQRQTSRLNGAKSCGPKTAAGKLRSSRNSRRHGLYSSNPFDPESDGPALIRFPLSPEDAFHVAHDAYLEVAALETRILNAEIDRQRTLHPGESDDTLLAIAYRYLADNTGTIQALERLFAAVSRACCRAAERLLDAGPDSVPRSLKMFYETNPAPGFKAPSDGAASPSSSAGNDFRGTNPAPNGTGTLTSTPTRPKRT